MMQNISFWNTTLSSTDDDHDHDHDDDHDHDHDHDDHGEHSHIAYIHDVSLKIIYIVIGSVGVADNLFVLVVFFLFISITAKVCCRICSLT